MTPHGLTSLEATRRLKQDGPNVFPLRRPVPAWRQLLAQMVHFFALMLWVAGGLAILAGMPQLGVAIFVVIVLNGTFAFLQEYRAERSGEKLRELLPRRATVMRDGIPVEIDAAGLVTGDVVLLRAGERISADIKLFTALSLSVDASTLTGESLPVNVSAGDEVHAGMFVVEGRGEGNIVATGSATRLAGIAQLTRAGRRPPTPLARELDHVVRVISIAAIVAGVLFLAIAAIVGIRLTNAFLFAIGVVVALVPEGLLPTVTLSLARGATKMAEHRALIRKLEAVETLGSTTFICTDKTGTLTLNQMSVVEVWTPAGTVTIKGVGYDPTAIIRAEPHEGIGLRDVAFSASYCTTGHAVLDEGRWIAQGDPLEAALDVFARRLGMDSTGRGSLKDVDALFPFDPRRRRMSAAAGGTLHVKGAPDAVLPLCGNRPEANAALHLMTGRGLRVLAVARRPIGRIDPGTIAEEVETGLELLGLIGIQDPPRPGIAESIAACRSAGIAVAMVTGDHPETARAIARQVGLLGADDWVIQGKDLPEDETRLGALVDRDGIVLSRVTPEDKLRIARALRARGHVVAMTGDGVNDGPALQEASIGIAMGRSGTDVAREAADLVLLDDNFETIVAAVKQGRATFTNTRRFLTYHLTDNVAELAPFIVWALTGGRFPLVLGVLQVLSLDIGTDILPALALGAEPPSDNVLKGPPHGRHLIDASVLMRSFGLLGPVEALVELSVFVISMAASGWRPGTAFPGGMAFLQASGAAFSSVVIGQMAAAFACRSQTRRPATIGWATNPLLLYALGAEFFLLLCFLYIPLLANILGHAPPTLLGAAAAAAAFPAVLVADARQKKRAERKRAQLHNSAGGTSPLV